MNPTRHHLTAALFGISLVAFVACGSDDSESSSTAPVTSEPVTTEPVTTEPVTTEPVSTERVTPETGVDLDVPMLTVGVRDYAFDDIPDSVAAGTQLSITNSSANEVHEMVVVKLADGDTRSASDLVALPLDELGALVGSEPAAVLIAPPMSAGFAVVGDGVLEQPGRYLVLCAIPVGADPEEYLAAAQAGNGPPQVEGGPPHFTVGMFADLVVEPAKN